MARSCCADPHVLHRKAQQGLGRSQDEKLDGCGYEDGLEAHLSIRAVGPGNLITGGRGGGGIDRLELSLFSFAEYPIACCGEEGEENPP